MAMVKTLVKAQARKGLSPDRVLSGVNENLCIDNPSSMYVTLFFAVFNTRTGELQYSNGGHNAPYFLDGEGNFREFETVTDMALGTYDDYMFKNIAHNPEFR
jgi:sigma-B regulation protein RsbU (phosphoserine phosphatase)